MSMFVRIPDRRSRRGCETSGRRKVIVLPFGPVVVGILICSSLFMSLGHSGIREKILRIGMECDGEQFQVTRKFIWFVEFGYVNYLERRLKDWLIWSGYGTGDSVVSISLCV